MHSENEKRHMNSTHTCMLRMRRDTQTVVHTYTARMRRDTQTVHA